MNTNGCSPAPRSNNFQFQLIDKQPALADSPRWSRDGYSGQGTLFKEIQL